MTTLSLQRTHELTFHVESPILTSGPASSTTPYSNTDYSSWTVTLIRSGQSLSVNIDWYREGSSYHQPEDNSIYAFMHIVPHGNDEDIVTTSINLPNYYNTTLSVAGKI